MKKTLLIFCFLAFSFSAFSQEFPDDIIPPSWKVKNLDKPSAHKLPAVDVESLKAEDANVDLSNPKPWRFGYELSVNHNIMTHGEWETLKNGDKIWRMAYKSNEATSLNFVFTEFYLPEGSKLFVYNEAKDDLLRPFSHHNNNPEEVLGTWLVQGSHAWIEYHQPAGVTEQVKLTIGGVVHGYRTAEAFQAVGLNDAEDCHYDVDCDITPSPDPYDLDIRKEEVKRATAMLLVGNSGFCSGTLINNTSNDGTPYVLTANHCGGNEGFWSFRFNWRSPNPSCGTTTPSTDGSFDQTVSGAILRANNSQSDMELVEITDTNFFTNNPDVVWAGWDRSTVSVPPTSFGIHHGAGDIQKVTRWDVSAQRIAINFNGNPNTEVWFMSEYGIGYIEPGSSGSSLYNQDGHVIGIAAAVTASQSCNGTTSNGQVFYGRFGEAWDFGSTSSTRLREWLDPADTGQEVLDIFPAVNVFDNDAEAGVGDNESELCGADFAPEVTIINRGYNTLNSVDITYGLDTESPTAISWIGFLAQNSEDVVATPVYTDLSPGPHTFTVTVSNPNGVVDQSPSNDIYVFDFTVSEAFETTNIVFDITTDNYGAETTWEVYDTSASPSLLVASGPSTPYANNSTFQETISLPTIDNCYSFVISDAASDGICCAFGNGSYTLSDDDGNIIITGGDFEDSESVNFEAVTSLSVTNLSLENAIKIYPNPVTNRLNILSALNTGEPIKYIIYNIIGQNMDSGDLSPNNLVSVDMSHLSSGHYFVTITSASKSFTKKIIKN